MSDQRHVVEDQSEAIAFLADPRNHDGVAVERVDTHGAIVVLAGDRAYKLKRAVRFPYMDFSTLALRERACRAELMLNRRTAPTLYLDVQPIVRMPAGGLAIGGTGSVLDWLVVMRRFDDNALFDRIAARGALNESLMSELANAILRFHGAAEPRADHGGPEAMARVIAGNDAGLREARAGLLDQEAARELARRSAAMLARIAPLLVARRKGGLVRHCHGDLHLRNICLIDGRPTLFDAIEFNEQFACIDVLYDLAFLLMDLDHRGFGAFGNLVLNRYLSEGARLGALGDLAGLASLPLFLACRAGVRAQVAVASAAAQPDATFAQRQEGDARSYLAQALRYVAPLPARLVAIGGLSGSGKSTVARGLAPAFGAVPGAVILRSDVMRKHLFAKDPLAKLGPEAYTPEITRRVYARICERAAQALAAGHAVIADAVFGDPSERGAIEEVARQAGVPFRGLWLEATAEILAARIGARRCDASDATVEVLRQQLGYRVGTIAWQRLEVSGAPAEVIARAASALDFDKRAVAGNATGIG